MGIMEKFANQPSQQNSVKNQDNVKSLFNKFTTIQNALVSMSLATSASNVQHIVHSLHGSVLPKIHGSISSLANVRDNMRVEKLTKGEKIKCVVINLMYDSNKTLSEEDKTNLVQKLEMKLHSIPEENYLNVVGSIYLSRIETMMKAIEGEGDLHEILEDIETRAKEIYKLQFSDDPESHTKILRLAKANRFEDITNFRIMTYCCQCKPNREKQQV